MPDAVAAARADGQLVGAGWMVRWRWHGDGPLEYRTSHRMTDERWVLLVADGAASSLDVPAGFKVFPKDATPQDRSAVEQAYRAAWAGHGHRVEERDMAFDITRDGCPEEHRGLTRMAWRTDGGPWTSSPLLA